MTSGSRPSESVIFRRAFEPETQAAVCAVFKHRVYSYNSIDYSMKPKRTAVKMPVFPLLREGLIP